MIVRRRITALVAVGVLGAFCGGVVPVIAQEDAGPANGVEGSTEPGRQAPAETQPAPTTTAEAPPAAEQPAAEEPAPQTTSTAATPAPAPAPEVVPEAEGNSTSQDEPTRETDSDDEAETHSHERGAGHALDSSDKAPDPDLREPDGTPTDTNPTFSWALARRRADRRSELLHRQVPDPAVPAADLPGGRHRVRRALGDPRRDQRDRDRLRAQPERLVRGRVGLDAVHARDVEGVRRRRQPRRQARTRTTRSTRSSPPPAT